ncbi:protein of unknown function [Hyphomicrobium sp. 1Nfss2.1]
MSPLSDVELLRNLNRVVYNSMQRY